MVQLKYFGDSRDYFKYDLITYLFDNNLTSNYVFIPMLTNHRNDGEGKKTPKHIEGKSAALFSFIAQCNTKDLEHWEQWLKPHVDSYITVHPVNGVFFEDSTRKNYWKKFESISKSKNALLFIDPDTGLETGKPSYLKKMGREKYILNEELAVLAQNLDITSVLMFYQHLPNNKHIHEESVRKKIDQAIEASGCYLTISYREDDLAFVFFTKSNVLYTKLCGLLEPYHKKSRHAYKSIHYAPNKANSADAKSCAAD